MTTGSLESGEFAAVPSQLGTSRFGRPLHVIPRVTSTNDVARSLAADGAGEGTAVLGLEQSGGRGRLGRSWASPAGGLYLSVILRPSLPVLLWPVLSLAAAVGSAEGIEAAAGMPVKLKWPNDLLVDARKVGGILLDSGAGFAVAGIGINVGASPGTLPEGAVSIDVALAPLARAVLQHLESAIDAVYADPAGTIRHWKARNVTLGRPVHVTGAEVIEGVAEDIDRDGALVVRTPSGVRRVVAGDVSLR